LAQRISLEKTAHDESDSYCTVRLIVLVAVAPPLALVAVTTTADVPAGVPSPFGPGVGVGPGAGVLLTPQPTSNSKAKPARAVASLIFFTLEFFERVNARANAVSPITPSSNVNCGGMAFGCGIADDRKVVAMVSVTGVVPYKCSLRAGRCRQKLPRQGFRCNSR
jgi:hypothetical protein